MGKIIHIAVMDYSSGTIKMYSPTLSENWSSDDVEQWLYENTDYSDTYCYYMCSENEIEIIYP